MSTYIAPIETRWFGCRFRSRLEARWAVFFEEIKLRWEYEPEGFQIGDIRYLPDFKVYTPQGKVIWYEVKPFNVKDDPKFSAFRSALYKAYEDNVQFNEEGLITNAPRVVLLSGHPKDMCDTHVVCGRCSQFLLWDEADLHKSVDDTMWYCYECDMETPSVEWYRDGLLESDYVSHKGNLMMDYSEWHYIQRRLVDAVTEAMSSRFDREIGGA